MRRSGRFLDKTAMFEEPSAMVRVWALRAIVGLNGQRQFLMGGCFSDDALAHFLGLGEWVDDTDGEFDRKTIRQELQRMHRAAEADKNSRVLPAFLLENVQRLANRFDLKVKFGFLCGEQAWALFTRYCEVLGVTGAGAAVKRELAQLGKLTAGDFATVVRQHRFRPLTTAEGMVAALRAECGAKESSAGQIGFL